MSLVYFSIKNLAVNSSISGAPVNRSLSGCNDSILIIILLNDAQMPRIERHAEPSRRNSKLVSESGSEGDNKK
jgi:hypothetical protein